MAVLLFLNIKGGVAKTTNCVAVAETFAVAGKRVLVIDADHQCTAGALLLGEDRLQSCEDRRKTLHDLFASLLNPEFDTNRFNTFIEPEASNIRGGLDTLSVLPCSHRIDEFTTNVPRARKEHLSPSELNAIFRRRRRALRSWLTDQYDHVIVDCPPRMALQVRALLSLADAFIIPSIPDRLSVMGTYGLMERLRRLGTRVPALGILWSLYRSQNEIHRDVIFASSRRSGPYSDLPKPFRTVIPNSVDVARAFQGRGEPRTLSSKYTPRIAILYRDLCKEILYRLRAMKRKQ